MERQEIELKITQMIEEALGEEVDQEADIRKEYDVDSIDILDFIMSIEDEFDLEFSDLDLEEMKSINDIVDRVEELVL